MLFLYSVLKAQEGNGNLHTLNIKHFTDENGLPQNSINGMAFDKNGFLWIATNGGLTLYDGQRFTVYTVTNTQALNSNRIHFLSKTSQGDVVFLTYSTGYRYYKIEPLFTITPSQPQKDNQFFWFTEFNGFLQITKRQDSLLKTLPPLSQNIMIKEGAKGGYITTKHGDLYYISDTIQCLNRFTAPFLFGLSQWALVADDPYTIWVYDKQHCIKRLKGFMGDIVNLKGNWLKEAIFFKNGEECFILVHNNIYTYRLEGDKITTVCVVHNLPTIKGISNILYHKRSGDFIIGSHTEGLYIIHENLMQSKILEDYTSISARNDEDGNNIYAQSILRNGDILASNGYVYSYSNITSYLKDISNTRFLYTDKKGYVWYQDEKYNLFKTLDGKHSILIGRKFPILNSLVEDGNKGFWVASYSNIYYIKEDILSDTLIKKPLSSLSNSIEAIYPLSDSVLWLATRKGLFRYSILKHLITPVEGTQDYDIRCMLKVNPDIYLWGTYGNGYFALYKGKTVKIDGDLNKYLNIVHCFVKDARGYLWMPTNKGLFRTREKDIIACIDGKLNVPFYQYFNKESGFGTNEFNGGSFPDYVLRKSDSLVSLPTLKGLVWFYPGQLKCELPDMPLYLTAMHLDNNPVSVTQNLQLKPDFKRLDFDITTPYFGQHENLDMEYKVEGYDTTWYPVNSNHNVAINGLKPGRYVVRIRKHNGFGIDNYSYLTLSINVTPFWYETWWFAAIVALCAIAFFVTIFFVRFKSIETENVVLESMVKEKTYELRTLNEKLSNTNNSLSVYMLELEQRNDINEKLTYILSHDLQSPLNFLIMISETLEQNSSLLSAAQIAEYMRTLKDESKNIKSFTKELLEWMQLHTHHGEVNYTRVDLRHTLSEVITLYADIAKANGNLLRLQCPDDIILNTDERLIKVIVRNLVDNANKNTRQGEIILGVELTEGLAKIWIKDTGKGMTEEELGYVEAIIQNKKDIKNKEFKLGFYIINDFVKELGGTIDIISAVNKGTTINITLPLKPLD